MSLPGKTPGMVGKVPEEWLCEPPESQVEELGTSLASECKVTGREERDRITPSKEEGRAMKTRVLMISLAALLSTSLALAALETRNEVQAAGMVLYDLQTPSGAVCEASACNHGLLDADSLGTGRE